MTMHSAAQHPDTGALLGYWLGDGDDARTRAVEEHWFGCADCAARLRDLVRLCNDVARVVRAGLVQAVLPAVFIERLRAAGIQLREYRLEPGASVACTVTPDDDLVVAHLHAPLGGVRRLDVLMNDSSGAQLRVEDVAFDPAAGEIVYAPSIAHLRRLGVATQHVRLVSVADGAEQVLADYTFNHSPHRTVSRDE
jgi:hypothetical protein